MNVLILNAGLGTRCKREDGNKCLVEYQGVPAIERQLAMLAGEDVTVVCRSCHYDLLRKYPVNFVIDDSLSGPVGACAHANPEFPVLVWYADTLVEHLPQFEKSWVAVAMGNSDREWDYYRNGWHRGIPPEDFPAVAVGLYQFAEPVEWAGEMVDVLNRTPHALCAASGWVDVGG